MELASHDQKSEGNLKQVVIILDTLKSCCSFLVNIHSD